MMMNAGLDHIKHVAGQLGTLATALAVRLSPDERLTLSDQPFHFTYLARP